MSGLKPRPMAPALALMALVCTLWTGCGGSVATSASAPSAAPSASASLSPVPTTSPVQGTERPLAHRTFLVTEQLQDDVQTATLLRDGRVVFYLLSESQRAAIFDPSTDTFQLTPASATAPGWVVAWSTLLPNGLVLLMGAGRAVLFDPADRTFRILSTDGTPRWDAVHALLADGRVLVAGGVSESHEILATAELFDPSTGRWTPTGSMHVPRANASASVLADGRALVSGGYHSGGVDGYFEDPDSIVNSAEVFDPSSQAFALVGSMTTPRAFAESVLLRSGKVLVVGGFAARGVDLASMEVFDPSSATFVAAGELPFPRHEESVSLLRDGTVLIAGGASFDSGFLAEAEIFDPTTGLCSPTGPMHIPRARHSATVLEDGRVLLVGGYNADGGVETGELYIP